MNKKAFMFVVMTIIGFLFLVFANDRFDRLSQVECKVSSVVAEYGDNLWNIGSKHCQEKETDMRAVVNELVKLNGANLQVGQLVLLPYKQP